MKNAMDRIHVGVAAHLQDFVEIHTNGLHLETGLWLGLGKLWHQACMIFADAGENTGE